MQNPFLPLYEPIRHDPPLDEEGFAQRHGRVVHPPIQPDRLAVRLGRLFLKLGQQLTHEDPCGELSREAA